MGSAPVPEQADREEWSDEHLVSRILAGEKLWFAKTQNAVFPDLWLTVTAKWGGCRFKSGGVA